MSFLVRKDVTHKKVKEAYLRLGVFEHVAKELDCSHATIRRRLQDLGFKDILSVQSRTGHLTGKERKQYAAWRTQVLTRDGYRCQVCGEPGHIPHHIRTWAKHPQLRFDTDNGIALCKECHLITLRREEEYEQIFLDLLFINHDIETTPSDKTPTPAGHRKCSVCGELKPHDQFYTANKCKHDRRAHRCKACNKQYNKEWYLRTKDERRDTVRVAQKKWAAKNKKHRQVYHLARRFKIEVASGKIPRWTKKRAIAGLVTDQREDWPTEEILDEVRKCR